MLVSLVVEGPSDIPIARRVVQMTGLEAGVAYPKGGKASLDARLAAYNPPRVVVARLRTDRMRRRLAPLLALAKLLLGNRRPWSGS